MRPSGLQGISVFLALALLLTLAVAPTSALTVQRTWHAKFSSGTYGAVTLKAYTNGTGTVTYGLKRLRATRTYSVQIRKGTCSSLGTTVATVTSVRTSASGTVARTNTVLSSQMNAIWSAAHGTSFVMRIVNGTSVHCAGFSFTKATRVVISTLGISLPIVRGPSGYPYCNVAMYLNLTSQPREPGISFIFAHARTGMFLPLLTKFKAYGAAGLLGRVVKVYTSDSYVSYYRVDNVRRTSAATTMNGVFDMSRERLWLQTSTGPNYTYPKLIVEAHRTETLKTTYAASHPTPHIVHCS
jgi:hypothetical protein